MIEKKFNPFYSKSYGGAKYFCDREEETQKLLEAALNRRDVTLYALRRMGKSGLIEHVGKKLVTHHNFIYIYSDIYNTENSSQLLVELTNSVIHNLFKSKSALQKIAELFKSIRPIITFDALTNQPQIEITTQSEQQVSQSLEELFDFVNRQEKQIYWAIDEFQQLSSYPENEQIIKQIRFLTQKSQNVTFVFSGSHTNMLLSIFDKAKQPFYRSTQLLGLQEIDKVPYKKFIIHHFSSAKIEVSDKAIDLIFEYTLVHTWFTQVLCNRLFSLQKNISEVEVKQTLQGILQEFEVTFYRFRQLMSKGQWHLLLALAKEGITYQPMGKTFIHQYKLSGTASIRQALHKLIKDEFVVELYNKEKRYYRLNDVFLMRWMAWVY